jgi:hypothetical protein
MTDMFDNPGELTGLTWENYVGRLMLLTPTEKVTGISTTVGTKDAIRADIVVLDGPNSPEQFRDALVFPLVLQGQLRTNVATGRTVLGRLGQGDKKPGQNAPWKLADPTEADKSIARAHLGRSTSNEAPF